ncbi:MAG TPA: DUF3592 domain-containing protein [Virgibacillus sp.]|nr:DUF3592 domain-containing protein [Virgibacillus sp.]HLR69038.1 DUF3592 domain-containing protein [Virgibacillus sp.]
MDEHILIVGTITGPFLLLGAIFFSFGFIRSQIAKKYERTTGIIVRGEKSSFLKHSNFNELIDKLYKDRTVPDRHPTVAYDIQGTTYTYKSAMSQQPGLPIGTEVDVLYNPNRPEKAIIDTFVQRGSLFTLLGSIFLALAVIGIGVLFYIVFL